MEEIVSVAVDSAISEIKSIKVPENAVEIEDIETEIGNCKNCKWWRDHDGLYRRGSHAESQCPINRREVLEGNGYCYVFEPQESEG